MADQEQPRDKQVPPEQIMRRGIVQDALGLALQEAKPIAEGLAVAWGANKLIQGKNPPPDSGKPD